MSEDKIMKNLTHPTPIEFYAFLELINSHFVNLSRPSVSVASWTFF